jgi:1,5-anhydro-D-fructose reductase (1,5-anhydro-D-mannitol-forming)
MKWGIVGAGAHAANNVAPGLANSRDNQLAGILGSSIEKSMAFAGAYPDARAYQSYEEMLSDRAIEAVFVTTPNDLHCIHTKMAAAAGKHVLVEKPMALNAGECQSMIDACAEAGISLGVGFHLRHHPVHIELKRMIEAGELGELVLVCSQWHTRYDAWTNWRADAERAGSDVLSAVGVHVLDLMGYLVGSDVDDVKSVVCNGADTGRDTTIAAALLFQSGVAGTATMTRRSPTPANGIWVFGTRGMAGSPSSLGMGSNGRMTVAIDGKNAESVLPMPDLFGAQFDAFSQAVDAGRMPSASGAVGLASVKLSNRILG